MSIYLIFCIMKKLLLTLSALLLYDTANAQFHVDEAFNKDSKVTILGLTTMVYLINENNKIKTKEELLASKWLSLNGVIL